jgi:[acyl-carrier-protein] S-malonyltransferase
MAADLCKDFPVAAKVFQEAEEAIGSGLKKLMFEGPYENLTMTMNTQPAILCHSIAVLRVLESEYGLDVNNFTFALGHSLGEYSALVATGALSFHDAIKLVRLRGTAMQECVGKNATSMKAYVINGQHLEEIENLMCKIKRSLPVGEVAEIANINSRNQIVLSGTEKGVEYAGSIINTRGFAGRAVKLPVSAPFHCSLMSRAQEKMKVALDNISFNEPKIEVISNVTGMPINDKSEINQLLSAQIVKTVQWQRSIQYACDDDVHDWFVLGPSRVLANLLRKEHPQENIKAISTVEDVKKHGVYFKDE